MKPDLIASTTAWKIAEHYKDGIKYEVGKENFQHAHQFITDAIKHAILEATQDLQKDKERLDWLNNDKTLLSIKATVGGWKFCRTDGEQCINNLNEGLRSAIDAAILQQQKENETQM